PHHAHKARRARLSLSHTSIPSHYGNEPDCRCGAVCVGCVGRTAVMEPVFFLDGKVELRPGDCRDVIKAMPDNSVDAVVTDPPYALVFMGKQWDTGEVAFSEVFWTECLRVLKPGGHVVAFSGTRTYHRM